MTASGVLLVLNEGSPGAASDWHAALSRLEREKQVRSSAVVPYIHRMRGGASSAEVLSEIAGTVRSKNLELVLWCHTHGLELGVEQVAGLREVGARAMGYWDGDWYHRFKAPFPGRVSRYLRALDVAFVCGDGGVVRTIQGSGLDDVRFVPLTTDERFPRQAFRESYDYDLVMVGNRIASRVPFKRMPGAMLRERLVRFFSTRLGDRFAVYGSGWTGPSARGVVAYDEQAEAYGSGMAALGCNNWFAKYYFSDRLPIAMSCGRPVIHYKDAGYDEVFGSSSGVYWFQDLQSAWARFQQVMESPTEARESALRGSDYAERHLTTYESLRYMVDVLEAKSHPAQTTSVPNPWIERVRL